MIPWFWTRGEVCTCCKDFERDMCNAIDKMFDHILKAYGAVLPFLGASIFVGIAFHQIYLRRTPIGIDLMAYRYIGLILMAIGGLVLMFVMPCLAGKYAFKKRSIKPLIYGFCLTGFAIYMIIAAVYMNREKKREIRVFEQDFYRAIRKYRYDPRVRKNWDTLQHSKRCCGVYSHLDWDEVEKDWRPNSCCDIISLTTKYKCLVRRSYIEGCYNVIKRKVVRYVTILGNLAVLICIYLLVGALISFLRASNLSAYED